jgi:hypothetical protein
MKTKQRPATPMSADAACIALLAALERQTRATAGEPVWFSFNLEDDVETMLDDLANVVSNYAARLTRLANAARRLHDTKQGRKIAAEAKKAAIAKRAAAIVTARNPRKMRHAGATR